MHYDFYLPTTLIHLEKLVNLVSGAVDDYTITRSYL